MQHPYKIKFSYYRIPNTIDVPCKGRPKIKYLHKYVKGKGWEGFSYPSRPLPKGGVTVCIIENRDGVRVQARASCSHSDNFCYALGREISLGRALKLYKQQ